MHPFTFYLPLPPFGPLFWTPPLGSGNLIHSGYYSCAAWTPPVGRPYGKNENLQKLPDAKENSKVDCDIIKQGIDDFSNQFRNIVDSLNITEKAKAKLQELIDYNFDVAFKTENTNYNEYYKHIIDYESDIIKNKSAYDKKDVKILLSASSTARYSAYFWKKEIDETDISNVITKRKWWQWAIIGVADVVGVVDGGITTGAGASTTAYTITNPKNK